MLSEMIGEAVNKVILAVDKLVKLEQAGLNNYPA